MADEFDSLPDTPATDARLIAEWCEDHGYDPADPDAVAAYWSWAEGLL